MKTTILAFLLFTTLCSTACSQSDSKKDKLDGDQSKQPKIVDEIEPEKVPLKEPPSKENGSPTEDDSPGTPPVEKNKPSAIEQEVRLWLKTIAEFEKLQLDQLQLVEIGDSLKGKRSQTVFFVTTKLAESAPPKRYAVKVVGSCQEFEDLEKMNAQLGFSEEEIKKGSPWFSKLIAWSKQATPPQPCFGLLEMAQGLRLSEVFKEGSPHDSNQALVATGRALGRLHAIHEMTHGDLNPGNIFYEPKLGLITFIDNQGVSKIDQDDDKLETAWNDVMWFKYLDNMNGLYKLVAQNYFELLKEGTGFDSYDSSDPTLLLKALSAFQFTREILIRKIGNKHYEFFNSTFQAAMPIFRAYLKEWPTPQADQLKDKTVLLCKDILNRILGGAPPDSLNNSEVKSRFLGDMRSVFPDLLKCADGELP